MRPSSLLALGSYLAVSFLYFGVPVAAHPARSYVGTGPDPQIFIWALAWWPHALAHGLDPVFTHVVWAPAGVDLAWTTSIPGLALLLAPVTAAAGAVVSYNVAAVVLPALAAWTAYLLCRHVTRATLPSLAGGYLFGFSSYLVGHELGHPHLTSVFAVPLVALVVVRFVERELDAAGLAVRLAPLLALQFAFSTEVFFTLTLALLVAAAIGAAVVPDVRPRLRALLAPVIAAYGVCAVLVSPLLVSALLHFRHGPVNPATDTSADVVTFLAPTRLTWIGSGTAAHVQPFLSGLPVEHGQYLGLPALAIVAWLAWTGRRRPGVRFLVLAALAAAVATLGAWLHVRGHRLLPLPWLAVRDLPVFDNVIPLRLSLYVSLAVAVAVAVWAARPRPSWVVRTGLTALAAIALVPNLSLDAWKGTPSRPRFFADRLYRLALERDATVLALPPPNRSDWMLWQAESGFWFRLANGNVSPELPRGVPMRRVAAAVNDNDVPPGGGAAVVALARAQHADAIVVDGRDRKWRAAIGAVVRGRPFGEMVIYFVP